LRCPIDDCKDDDEDNAERKAGDRQRKERDRPKPQKYDRRAQHAPSKHLERLALPERLDERWSKEGSAAGHDADRPQSFD
jgi:hypothetical protein